MDVRLHCHYRLLSVGKAVLAEVRSMTNMVGRRSKCTWHYMNKTAFLLRSNGEGFAAIWES